MTQKQIDEMRKNDLICEKCNKRMKIEFIPSHCPFCGECWHKRAKFKVLKRREI